MKKRSPDDLFRIGKKLLKDGKPEKALALFGEAIKKAGYQDDRRVDILPRYLSYLGLATALAERRYRTGAEMCEDAILREARNPVLFLNLGKVLAAGGYKRKAVNAFYKGLEIDPSHGEILAEIRKIGVRHKPVIPLIPRKHPINKYLGLFFYGSRNHPGRVSPPSRS